MAELERTYNVPLRQKFMRVPKYKRSRKAVVALREFIAKHMKSEDVKIGKALNDLIWENGIRNPPHHVKVVIRKGDDGIAKAELYGHKYSEPTKEEMEKAKTAKPKSDKKMAEKVKDAPELVDKALKNQKGLKKEQNLEKLEEDLEKQEMDVDEKLEEQSDIKEALDEIKAPAKKTPKKE